MKKFGYVNQPYIIWLHKDIDHKHMYIVPVPINEQGGEEYHGIMYGG